MRLRVADAAARGTARGGAELRGRARAASRSGSGPSDYASVRGKAVLPLRSDELRQIDVAPAGRVQLRGARGSTCCSPSPRSTPRRRRPDRQPPRRHARPSTSLIRPGDDLPRPCSPSTARVQAGCRAGAHPEQHRPGKPVDVACLLVDEAQFLDGDQVDDLLRIAVLGRRSRAGLRHPHRLPDERVPRLPAAAGARPQPRGAQDHLPMRPQGALQRPPRRRASSCSTATRWPSTSSRRTVTYESLCAEDYLRESGGRLDWLTRRRRALRPCSARSAATGSGSSIEVRALVVARTPGTSRRVIDSGEDRRADEQQRRAVPRPAMVQLSQPPPVGRAERATRADARRTPTTAPARRRSWGGGCSANSPVVDEAGLERARRAAFLAWWKSHCCWSATVSPTRNAANSDGEARRPSTPNGCGCCHAMNAGKRDEHEQGVLVQHDEEQVEQLELPRLHAAAQDRPAVVLHAGVAALAARS